MRILVTILLLFSLSATAQRSILVGGTGRSSAQVSAGGGGFVRDNLEAEITWEQDGSEEYEYWSGVGTAYKFQAIEDDDDFEADERNTTYARYGTHSMKLTIDKTQPTGDRFRTELVWFHVSYGSSSRRIYGWSQRLSAGFETNSHLLEGFQLHAKDDNPVLYPGEGSKISAVGFYLIEGEYRVNLAWNNAQPTSGHAGDHWETLGDIDDDINVWVDWVFDCSFNPAGGGQVKIYKNGVLIYTYNGPLGYNDIEGCYAKWGPHRPGEEDQWSDIVATTQVIYYDDIRVGGAAATYEDVAPGPDTIVFNDRKKSNIGNARVDWIEHIYINDRRKLKLA